ncbi:XTP/dITP diphosphatase [Bacillus sp. 2205SS5-2]|uniref:XTP/dITP diphosphatase n=1 Tax=Bacillus sp. 2205SS5-2 TaxID=3109031 RepID=UPI003006CADD
MKKTVLIATKNKGKAKEFTRMFAPYGFNVKTLLDIEGAIDVKETGSTFAENALLKAETIANTYQTMVISDDSGLMIDALNGEPGVYSARYAGGAKSDEANMEKVLEKLKEKEAEQRTARFCCTLAVAAPGMDSFTVEGSCEGEILSEKRGENGFGYDPIFFVPSLGKAMAELSPEEKNSISHRGNALRKLEKKLPALLSEASTQ